MNRLLTITQTFLSLLWKFFQLPFPGTNVSVGALLAFPVVVAFTLAFIRSLFGVGGFAQISGSIKDTSSLSRVDRLNTKYDNSQAKRFVKRGL